MSQPTSHGAGTTGRSSSNANERPRLAAVNFGFNAWGYKLSPFEEDDAAAMLMAEKIGVPVFDFGEFVLEGGSIDVNGQGTVLTTESCLLNPNRNPDLSREQIEATLRESLGVTQVLWLGDGIEGDDTDGHVDDITRFVSPNTVVTVVEEDEDDPNYEPLELNFQRLRTMQLSNGSPLRVLKLPMPSRIAREGQRLPASYANFYVGQHGGPSARLPRHKRRVGGLRLEGSLSRQENCPHRLPRTHLGPRCLSLPDPATAGRIKPLALHRRNCKLPAFSMAKKSWHERDKRKRKTVAEVC